VVIPDPHALDGEPGRSGERRAQLVEVRAGEAAGEGHPEPQPVTRVDRTSV